MHSGKRTVKEQVKDFAYVDVPAMLAHYSNPSENWRRIVVNCYRTEVDFYKRHKLVREGISAWSEAIEKTVIMFSEFTEEGQAFVKSLAVEKWRQACDRARPRRPDVDTDPSGLERRFAKFRESRSS